MAPAPHRTKVKPIMRDEAKPNQTHHFTQIEHTEIERTAGTFSISWV